MAVQDGDEVAAGFHFDPCPHIFVSVLGLGEGSPEAVMVASLEFGFEEDNGPQTSDVSSLIRQIEVGRTAGSFYI